MRTIKFRGKNKITGEWFYGNLYDKDTKGRTHIGTPQKYCLCINPDTVGQFTGQKDKKGKDIYEGDILQLENGRKSIVEWNDSKCGFNIVSYGLHLCMVIGNIHDNPELVKEIIFNH